MTKRTSLFTWLAITACILSIPVTTAARTIHVDADAAGANDGTSWENAYYYLQDALADANDGDEIRVAQGVYRPDQGEGITPGDRGAAFGLRPDVPIRGGYAGYGSPDPNARDVNRYKTILSGDLAGNDVEVADPCDLLTEPSRAENSEHILTVGGATPVLDGFTVTSANCSYSGGGIVMGEADLVVTDCVFTANSAGYCGGAMTGWNSRVVFERCQFIGNAAAGSGGAVFMETCTCRDGYLGCVDCKFINNSAGQDGGAIYIGNYPYMLTSLMNCLIAGNKAGGQGAALHAYSVDGTWLVNCTLSGNWAKSEGPCPYEYGGVSLINCILRYNQGSTICPAPSYLYTFTEGASGEPGFVSPGYWDVDELWVDGDYHLQQTSPLINAGDPEFISQPANPTIPGGTYIGDPEQYIIRSSDRDLDGWPRVIGGRVDMGAYEYQGPKIIYVDDAAAGANDGTRWENAYYYLQDALMFAAAGDEIRVAQGVYRPDDFVLSRRPNLGREETFHLENGVAIKGGYAGLGQPDPNARDIELYETILSGDLSKTLPTLTEENFEEVLYNRGVRDYRNSYHVVAGSGTDATAVLDGFVVTGGTANGPAFGERAEPKYFCGGGVYVESGSPTLVDCLIRGNVAFVYGGPPAKGGGMFNMNGSPLLIRCSFVMNWTDDMDSDAYGAGMMNQDSSPTLLNCIFENNSTWNWGGGMCNIGAGSVTLTGCTFVENWGQYGGGAIRNELSADQILTASGCLFAGNGSTGPGAGVSTEGGPCVLTNCTFVGNRATDGSGNAIRCGSWGTNLFEAINCILWDGGHEICNYGSTETQITFCDVQGGWEEQGNIYVDPCFADYGYWDVNGTPEDPHDDRWIDGDYHLKSQAGRWGPAAQTWIVDDVTSPCIDVGDPMTPIGREPFPNGGIINMGAYGGTVEASKSYFGNPPCETIIAGDINGDCEVNFLDFSFMALHWMEGHD